MTPEQCKALLNAGILQAYAEGKQIEYRSYPHSEWRVNSEPYDFDGNVTQYRIKPEPIPHTFETAIKAIAKHGMKIKAPCSALLTANKLEKNFIDLNGALYRYKELLDWTFPDGTPFHQGEQ